MGRLPAADHIGRARARAKRHGALGHGALAPREPAQARAGNSRTLAGETRGNRNTGAAAHEEERAGFGGSNTPRQ